MKYSGARVNNKLMIIIIIKILRFFGSTPLSVSFSNDANPPGHAHLGLVVPVP